jgi:predicted GIY-YIG superfamily endonuclease
MARVSQRTPPQSNGCPTCSPSGFKPGQPAWFYLLQRPGEQQIGVTNEPEVRLVNHSKNGWFKVELVGPFPGDQVLALEKKLKKWLRKEVGLVPGAQENWFTARMEVQSLAELKARSGVETDLF